MGQRAEIKALARQAQLGGATHGCRVGPAIAFYRPAGNGVETCFAEYNPSSRRYEWMWEPPDWRGGQYMPSNAVPIEHIVRRGI